jgi:gamma-glutamyltranspeptidase
LKRCLESAIGYGRNTGLARTLDAIASDGWYGFYDGGVAHELLRYSDDHDGFSTSAVR